MPASQSPSVAILHIDSQLRRRLVARRFDLTEKEFCIDDTQVLPAPCFVDAGASLLVPINGVGDEDVGGILVIGGGSCEYIGCTPPKSPASTTPGKQTKSSKGKAHPPGLAKKRVRENSTASVNGENKCLKIDIPLDDVTA